MTPKQLVYTRHARRRLRERGITRPQVRELIATGERTRDGENVFRVVGRVGRQPAAVIFREDARTIRVITVQWIRRRERRKGRRAPRE